MYRMTLIAGSDRVVKYRHFFPSRAARNRIWSVRTVLPEPGSPAIATPDCAGIPPPRIASNDSSPVLSSCSVGFCLVFICLPKETGHTSPLVATPPTGARQPVRSARIARSIDLVRGLEGQRLTARLSASNLAERYRHTQILFA